MTTTSPNHVSSLDGFTPAAALGLHPEGEALSARKLLALVELVRKANSSTASSTLLQEAATMVAQCCDAECFSSGLVTSDGTRLESSLRRLTSHGRSELQQRYTLPMQDMTSLECRLMREGQSRIIDNLNAEPLGISPVLTGSGMQSAVVSPLMCDDTALGTLAIYDRLTRKFCADDLLLVDAAAQVVATTLARRRASELLQRQQRLMETLTGSMDALMLVLSTEGRIQGLNRACCELTGYEAAELRGRSLWSALLLPEELKMVSDTLAKLQDGGSPQRFESFLLTREGVRRRISWSFSRLAGDGHSLQAALVGTGIDVTAQHTATQRAVRAEAVIDELGGTHTLLKTLAEDSADEIDRQREFDRRTRRRHSYPYVQLLSPLLSDKIPPPEAFHQVLCRDLSSCGFSYFAETAPSHQNIVVAFGRHPSIVYLTAEIRHSTKAHIDGQELLIVGCRFTGRMEG